MVKRVLGTSLFAAALAATAVIGVEAGDKHETKGLAFGDKAPMLEAQLKNVDGEMITLADVQGEKGTLVVFSCNGCPWVVAWEERLVEIGHRAQEEGIGVVFINANDPGKAKADGYEEMQARAEERGMKFPYVVDATSDVARAFGATRTPEAFLFDGKGKLVYHGTIDDNARAPEKVEKTYLKDAVLAVANGEKVGVQKTKALGCSIKFRTAQTAKKSDDA